MGVPTRLFLWPTPFPIEKGADVSQMIIGILSFLIPIASKSIRIHAHGSTDVGRVRDCRPQIPPWHWV
jgi:hypothetical protein